MSKAGRPSILTPERKKTFIKALENGSTIKLACALAGFRVSTVCEWIQRGKGEHSTRQSTPEYAEFAAEVERAIARSELTLLKRVNAASRDDWRAASWILERRFPAQWSNTQRIALQVEREVKARMDGELNTQINSLFRNIMDDESIPLDAKRKMLEHASQMKEGITV